jgi:hypothetical protein
MNANAGFGWWTVCQDWSNTDNTLAAAEELQKNRGSVREESRPLFESKLTLLSSTPLYAQ